MAKFKEYDVVRIAKLNRANRYFTGTLDVTRPPRIGEFGTIVHISEGSNPWCVVESVDENGLTVWLADFTFDELELVDQNQG